MTITRRALLGVTAAASTAAVVGWPPLSADAVRAHPQHPHGPCRPPGAIRTGICPGDTYPRETFRLPATAFRDPQTRPTAKVIDVTRVEEQLGAPAGTNATPDDPSDDDADAFIYALNFIRDLEAPYGTTAWREIECSWVLYVPAGTYHVGKTIAYTGEVLPGWVKMRILGENRERTTIRLKDGVAGWAQGQAVIDFDQDDEFNNWQAQNLLRNVTVDIGDNPGATGVEFFGANNARIENVTIRDPHGVGRIGLTLAKAAPGDPDGALVAAGIAAGYYSDITIEGFEHSILAQPYHLTMPALEHVTLDGPRSSGIQVGHSLVTVRGIHVVNTDQPAIRVTGTGAHVVVLDSVFEGHGAEVAAIDSSTAASHLFVRNVRTKGYPIAVRHESTTVRGPLIKEWLSDEPMFGRGQSPSGSLALYAVAQPVRPDTGLRGLVNVDDFGARGNGIDDDTAAVQRALDARGARALIFPKQQYRIDGTLRVPATVRRLDFLWSRLVADGPGRTTPEILDVAQRSSDPLWIENVDGMNAPDSTKGSVLVRHRATRTVVLASMFILGAVNLPYVPNPTGRNGTLFLTNINGIGRDPRCEFRNQDVHCRWINSEDKARPNFLVGPGARVLVHGFKCEGGTTSFAVRRGGVLEVLGGVQNHWAYDSWEGEDVAMINDGGTVSIVLSSNGEPTPAGHVFEIVMRDSDATGTTEWTPADFPPRSPRPDQWVMPLFRS